MPRIFRHSFDWCARDRILKHVDCCIGQWWFLAHAPLKADDLSVKAGYHWAMMQVEGCCMDEYFEAYAWLKADGKEGLRPIFLDCLSRLRLYPRDLEGQGLIWSFELSPDLESLYPYGVQVLNMDGQHYLDFRRVLSEN